MNSSTTHYCCRTFFVLFISLLIVSCSKDEDEAAPATDAKNELEYNGETYALNYGGLESYGFDGSHMNYEFHIFKFISEENPIIPAYLYLDLYSPHESGFEGGTFDYIDTDDPSDLEGKSYFDDGYFIRNMNTTDETAEELVRVKGGTVKISGNGNKYTLEIDLMMDNDKPLKGSYGGNFESLSSAAAASRDQTINYLLNK